MNAASEPAMDLLPSLKAKLAATRDGEHLKPVGMSRVLLGADALDSLVGEVRRVAGDGPITVLEDATRMVRAGVDLKRMVGDLLNHVGFPVRRVVIGPPDGALHADAGALEMATQAVAGAGCVVSIGSGTITDVAKHACSSVPHTPPLVAVQTAVSVNGFSDDMAVVLHNGVKRTIDSRWVTTLLIDTQVLRDAPARLNQSGVGELMAMFTAPADWRLAAMVGLDSTFSPSVVDLFRRDGQRLLDAAPLVGQGDRQALGELAAVMTASGIALGVAGHTAPISGMEHTVSHMLDMSAGALGKVGLHGAQVGVAALVSACLWERLLDRLDPAALTHDGAFPHPKQMRERVLAAFSELDSSGAMARECWADYQTKLASWHAARPTVTALAGRWQEAAAELRPLICDAAAIATALRSAGAPATFAELDPSVSAERARWAVVNCHLMRNRFTVADLAFFTGHWTTDDAIAVLARAAELADASAPAAHSAATSPTSPPR